MSLQQTLFSMVKTENIPPKIRKKTRVSTFTTIIQHHSGSSSYSNQRRKRNKRNSDQKRSHTLTVCRWHDTEHQFSSVAQLCPTLCDPMNCSSPGLLSITNSRSSLKLTSIESVMSSSHVILCHLLLLLPPIPPCIKVFSNESTLRMRGQSIGVSALASVLPKNTQEWSPLEWTGWISLQSKALSRVFSNTTVQKHQFFGAQPSSQSNSHIHTWPQEKP